MRKLDVKNLEKLTPDEQIKEIQRMFSEIADIFVSTSIPEETSIQIFPKTKEMRIPQGWAICDGQNKTSDLRPDFGSTFVYIQRVK